MLAHSYKVMPTLYIHQKTDHLGWGDVNKRVAEVRDVIVQMDQTDRTFHPHTREYMFISVAHGSFNPTDHIVEHKKKTINKYRE